MCDEKSNQPRTTAPCAAESACASSRAASSNDCPLTYFRNMLGNCFEYAQRQKAAGNPIVGILCEYTPREVIMAAGAVPVCLCGGSAATIPAAEEDLPANLCPLIKSTYGYHRMGNNPFLEMADLVVAETTCDGKKKMYELMAETRPMYVLELPQKQDDRDARAYWRAEVRKFSAFLEARFETAITDEKLREAIRLMNRERGLRRSLASLMKADAPPITGRQLIELKSSISGIPADFEQYEKALAFFSGDSAVIPANRAVIPSKAGIQALDSRFRGNDGAVKVRVLMTGVPMPHGAERVLDIIENHGGLVVCMENCTGIKPILEDVDCDSGDPLTAIADKYFHLPCSVMTRNDARLDSLRNLAKAYRAECIIELVWQTCLTYDVEAARVRRLAEQELGLPYLRIETDYSPSDTARIAVRVEALFETIHGGGKKAGRQSE